MLAYRCRHHNSPGLSIAVNIAMSWVRISSHIIMWVLGLVNARVPTHPIPYTLPSLSTNDRATDPIATSTSNDDYPFNSYSSI